MAMAEMEKTGSMLRQALENSGTPAKCLAMDSNYSVDAVYATLNGKRKIPRDARHKIAQMHPLGGLAVAYEGTGYNFFQIVTGDMHPQNMLQKALKEDADVDEKLKQISWMLIDKRSSEDMTKEEQAFIKSTAKELIEEIRALISLLVVWEDQFKIQLVKMFLENPD
ncbi:MAG: hypothetical protein PHI32_15320, partial [Dysgonamonadaceae bacterium]|nr:hypothetical protein [Dysgonamonadaceae bacterium]